MMDKAGSTIKGSIISALAEHGHWPFANNVGPAHSTCLTGSLPLNGIINKAIPLRNTTGQIGLCFARKSTFTSQLDHETPFCEFGRKVFQSYQASHTQDARTNGDDYVQEASPPKSTIGAEPSFVSHQRMISECTYAERTDSEYAGSDRDWSSDDNSVTSSAENEEEQEID
ncbi:hypothetical protein Landi51_02767 [Colletotrichum acutatum]